MISKEIKKKILQGMLGQGSYSTGSITIAPKCYIGLATDDTVVESESGVNFTEPSSDAGYKRYLIGDCNSSATYRMEVKASGEAKNNDTLYFNEASASWGEVKWFGLFTAATGGSPFAWGRIVDEATRQPTSITVEANQLPIIKVEQLVLTLTDND